jgi:hypothetical protein
MQLGPVVQVAGRIGRQDFREKAGTPDPITSL